MMTLILDGFNIPNTKCEHYEATDSIIPKGTTSSKMNVFLNDLFSIGLCQIYTISKHFDWQLDLIFAYDQKLVSVHKCMTPLSNVDFISNLYC